MSKDKSFSCNPYTVYHYIYNGEFIFQVAVIIELKEEKYVMQT